MAVKSSRDNYDWRKTSSKPITGRSKRNSIANATNERINLSNLFAGIYNREQGRPNQSRADQGRAGQGMAGHGRAGQNRERLNVLRVRDSSCLSGKFVGNYFDDMDGNEGIGVTSKGQRHWVKEFQSIAAAVEVLLMTVRKRVYDAS
ncbi:hypothetical protein M0804_001071 [Polistes exclamans]|nr:hypothetical protein M0804_001071 [Polistes exclamans]